ncbi:MAG TPA: DNA repair protein RadC [Candidatus Aquicultor sp.]|jgi:DNA repair protein RadC
MKSQSLPSNLLKYEVKAFALVFDLFIAVKNARLTQLSRRAGLVSGGYMVTQDYSHITIKQLPPDVRPRERLIQFGAGSLSNAELLAIVVGTGTKNKNTVQVSEALLTHFETLGSLGSSTIEELCGVSGIGKAKATKILAALELGRRAGMVSPAERVTIGCPEDVARLLMPEMRYLDREHFRALILNIKHQVIKIVDISIGSLNASVVHPRELFKAVVRHSGAAVIVVHNHPSGDPTPSSEDIAVTKRLKEAGAILGIELLDHIVLGDGRFVSLNEYNLR